MRNAPSVKHPVGRSRLQRLALGLAWSASTLTFAAWTLLADAPGWRHGAGGAALALCALCAWRAQRAHGQGELSWDGAAWRWTPDSPPSAAPIEVTLELALDLQRLLLVRASARYGCARGERWLWLEPTPDRARWLALRRAVYSRAEDGASPESQAALP